MSTPEGVFTGDTLMGYSVGRCDLPTGDEAALAVSLQKLAALPGDPRDLRRPRPGDAPFRGEAAESVPLTAPGNLSNLRKPDYVSFCY